MSKPRFESDELAAEALSAEALSAEALSAEALSAEALSAEALSAEVLSPDDTALLARVRRQRHAERAPESLRQRARARALSEAAGLGAAHALPAAALVSVARPSLRFGVRLMAVAALVLGAIVAAPPLLQTASQRFARGPEPQPSPDWQASGTAGELLERSSPLLRLPLLPLAENQPWVSGPSLFAERPFSEPGRAWQVRRWNDPKADPEQPAAVDFQQGALCAVLATGERVLGGWPWPALGAAPAEQVPIAQGRAYRLGFRAWVRGPLPSQLLLGVGHVRFPFVAAAAARVQVSAEPARFALDFVAGHDDDAVGVAFLATNGRHADPTRVCLADVTLTER